MSTYDLWDETAPIEAITVIAARPPEWESEFNRLAREVRHRIWNLGTDIGTAWMRYGDGETRRLQTAARGTPRSGDYIQDMLSNIYERLSRGELVAIGRLVEPQLSEGLVFIPSDVFSTLQGPDVFETDKISSGGWRFEEVRVLGVEAFCQLLANECEQYGSAPTPTSISVAAKPKRRGGRRSDYPTAKPILDRMFEDHPEWNRYPASKLIHQFNKLWCSEVLPDGHKRPDLSERTLRAYLTRYRNELEKAGK